MIARFLAGREGRVEHQRSRELPCRVHNGPGRAPSFSAGRADRSKPALAALCALAAVLLAIPQVSVGSAAATGSIRGRIDVRRPAPLLERRPNVAAVATSAPAATLDLDRMRSVVYLETAPRGAFEQIEPAHAIMDQRNETFVPHVLAITTGTIVDFPNSDRIYHNVFSLSKTRSFDLGRYAAGRSKSVRFDRPGIVRVFCEIHSHMSAFILVFSHPFFTMTDVDGRYRLDNIPPGTYTVVAWNEGDSSEPTSVTVPSGGTAELDLPVR
jgi:plastocyanin